MTLDEAFEFFANYGNVSAETERLRNTVPKPQDLQAAIEHAVRAKGQPRELAQEAARLVGQHFDVFESPRDETIVRESVVEQMMSFWERGEVYTFPYTRAEVAAAERRWIAESRSCPAVPNRQPWVSQRGAQSQ
jgi:hypothetical protein